MSENPAITRAEGKERTRRAILDAALALTQHTSLGSISLRQVAKEVGIVPTAFYRHFATIDDLGLTLVDESLVSLRSMLREVRRGEAGTSPLHLADTSASVLVDHLDRHRPHFAFIARERHGTTGPVREAIRHEIELCELDLATDLARLPALATWSAADLRAFSALIVTTMVSSAEELINARPEQEGALIAQARTQLRMLVIGAINWRGEPPPPA